jgi:hypothetical protein
VVEVGAAVGELVRPRQRRGHEDLVESGRIPWRLSADRASTVTTRKVQI